MCLDIKKGSRLKTAKEDIVCYKMIRKCNETYYTWYKRALVVLGETYVSCLVRKKSPENVVEDGIHSFKNLIDLKNFVHWMLFGNYYIVECIIPKGSKYYEGMFSKYPSYASTALTYPKETL
jgi:hypothetical protein